MIYLVGAILAGFIGLVLFILGVCDIVMEVKIR